MFNKVFLIAFTAAIVELPIVTAAASMHVTSVGRAGSRRVLKLQ